MKFSLFISLLGARAGWANQSLLSATSGKCLSPSDKIKADSYNICCPGAGITNEETAGGVKFRYTCASWANPVDSPGHTANSARECAQLCASSSNCAAASWFSSMGKCYLTSSQNHTPYGPSAGALLLEKTRDSYPGRPQDDCAHQVAVAVADFQKESEEKCRSEKGTLEQSKALCELEKTALEEKLKGAESLVTDTELSVTNSHTLCPKYNGRVFETTGPSGSKHKWRIHCNHGLYPGEGTTVDDSLCSSPYKRLTEMHELGVLAWGPRERCYRYFLKPGISPSSITLATLYPAQEQWLMFVRIDY